MVRFSTSGRVTFVALEPPISGAMSACIAEHLRALRVDPSIGSSVTIRTTVVLATGDDP
jgi:hypothetical protein